MATAARPKLLGEGYNYDVSTDYAAVMNDAVTRGDYKAAAVAEQQRNAKIRGTGGSEKDMTNNFGFYLDNGESADYGYGYGYTMGNQLQQVTDKKGNVYYTNATRMDDPNLKGTGIDFGNIASVYSFTTPGGVDENYEKHRIQGGEVTVRDYNGLTDAEKRALLNEQTYRDQLLSDWGMSLNGTVGQDIAGGLPKGSFEKINTNLNGLGGLKNDERPQTRQDYILTDNPYADLITQTQQYYDDNEGAINDYIAAWIAAQEQQLQSQKRNIEAEAEDAQREAYINRLQNERALPELLAAQGVNGGATESAMMDMLASYGQNRAAINNQRADALNEVDNAIADVRAQAETERLNQLMNNNQNAMSAYQSLYGNMVDYDLTQQQLAMQQAEAEAQRQEEAVTYALSLAEAGLLDGEGLYDALSGMGVSRDLAMSYAQRVQDGLTKSNSGSLTPDPALPDPAPVVEDAAYVANLRRLAAESARSGGASVNRAAAEIGAAMDNGLIGEATGQQLLNLLLSYS